MLANYAERYLLKMADGLDRRERKIQMKKNLSLTFVLRIFTTLLCNASVYLVRGARSGSKVEKENRHDRENDITHRSRLNYLLERATKITRQVEPYFTMSPAARLYRSACIPSVDIVFATTEKTGPAPIAFIYRWIAFIYRG